MVDRGCGDGDAEFSSEAVQSVQKRHRIRAARASHEHMLTPLHERTFRNGPPNLSQDHSSTLALSVPRRQHERLLAE